MMGTMRRKLARVRRRVWRKPSTPVLSPPPAPPVPPPPVPVLPPVTVITVEVHPTPEGSDLAREAEEMLATRDFRDEMPELHRPLADALRNWYKDTGHYSTLLRRVENVRNEWRWENE